MMAPFSGGWVCGSIRYVRARAPIAMRRRRAQFVPAAAVSELAASAPIVAPLYSRGAKRLQNSCPFASPRRTVRKTA